MGQHERIHELTGEILEHDDPRLQERIRSAAARSRMTPYDLIWHVVADHIDWPRLRRVVEESIGIGLPTPRPGCPVDPAWVLAKYGCPLSPTDFAGVLVDAFLATHANCSVEWLILDSPRAIRYGDAVRTAVGDCSLPYWFITSRLQNERKAGRLAGILPSHRRSSSPRGRRRRSIAAEETNDDR